jgi:hypothetical protein
MVRRAAHAVIVIISVTVNLVLLPFAINLATGASPPAFLMPYVKWLWPGIVVLWIVSTGFGLWELSRKRSSSISRIKPDHPKNRPNTLDTVQQYCEQRLLSSPQVHIALQLVARV